MRSVTPEMNTRLLGAVVWIRRLLWLYFWLLLFEGALRKWLLPQLSDLLLIIRDPVVVAIYIFAVRGRLFPLNSYVQTAFVLCALSVPISMVFGHGNLIVALYGVRTAFLHIPLIFILPKVFNLHDVLRMGKAVLVLAIPMTMLLFVQLVSPPDAWVNRGLGGEGTAGFDGAMGYMRPPGTFSFISGPISFYPIATAFLFFGVFVKGAFRPLLMFGAAAAIIGAQPVSISRSLVLSCVLVVVVASIVAARSGQLARGLFKGGILGVLALVVLSRSEVFKTGQMAFAARWEDATEIGGGFEGAIVGRIVHDLFGPLSSALSHGVMGMGIGAGTNVGAKFLAGELGFLAGEGEWFRVINEMGPFLGAAYIALRVALGVFLLRVSLQSMQRPNPLPLLLFSACAFPVVIGAWGPPTIQGFATLGAGLTLAASRLPQRRSGKDLS